jgi:hypothetical protein
MGIGDWGLGIGDWVLVIAYNLQFPIPNHQSPIPNFFCHHIKLYFLKIIDDIFIKYYLFATHINERFISKQN